jgi:hypothetical protein
VQYHIKKDILKGYLNTSSSNNNKAYFLSVIFILVEFTSRASTYLSLFFTILPFFIFRKIHEKVIYLLFIIFLVPKNDRLVLYNIINNLESSYFSIYDIKLLGFNLVIIITFIFLFFVFSKSKTILLPKNNIFLKYSIILLISSTIGLILNGFDVYSLSEVFEDYLRILIPILYVPIVYFFRKKIDIQEFFITLLIIYTIRGFVLLIYDFSIGNFTPNTLVEIGFCLPIFLANYQVNKKFVPRLIKYLFFIVIFVFNGRGPILIFIVTFLIYLSLQKIHKVFLKGLVVTILIYIVFNFLFIYFPEYFGFISFKLDIINEISKGALSHSPKVRSLELQFIVEKNLNNFISILFGQGPGGYIEGIGSLIELDFSDYGENEILYNKYYKVHSFLNHILLKYGFLGMLMYLILPFLGFSNKLGIRYKYLSYLIIPTIIYSSFWRIDVTLFFLLIISLKQNLINENTFHLECSTEHQTVN